jgi:hypothetical protein
MEDSPDGDRLNARSIPEDDRLTSRKRFPAGNGCAYTHRFQTIN